VSEGKRLNVALFFIMLLFLACTIALILTLSRPHAA